MSATQKRYIIFKIGLWLTITATVGLIAWLVRENAEAAKVRAAQYEKEMQNKVIPKTPIEVMTVETSPLRDTVTRPGLTEAWEDVLLASSQRGIVEWVGFDEGDLVEAGRPVCRVETTLFAAYLKQAESALVLAKKNLERTQRMVGDGTLPSGNLDTDSNAVEQAEAAVELARENLRLATIVSPITGIMESREIEPGEHVDSGKAICLIVNLDRVKVRVSVPEREVAEITVGKEVETTIDAFPREVFRAKVYRVATVSDPITKTFDVEMEIPNPEGKIRAGMVCRATFVLREVENAILVPLYTLLKRDSEVWVFLEDNGTARKRPVKIGAFLGEDLEIVSGLSAGDRLIVTGQRELSDGQAVDVVSVKSKTGTIPAGAIVSPTEEAR